MKVFKKLFNCFGESKRKHNSFLTALFLIFSILISFTSCENFMNGNLVKNELEAAIDYANAPFYEVLVTAEEGTGTIIIGSGNNKVKVTDSFNIGFRKSSGYKFVRWIAVSKDGKKSMEEYVTIDEKTELNTKVTLENGSPDIQIKPLCEASLSVIESYPEFKEEGVARDSSIKLLLTAPLSDKNDLSRITIDIDNSNVKGSLYFNEPEMVENQLVITAKASNRISVVEGTTKTVTVTIPADFLYVGVNGEFEIGEELQHTYRINSTTRDKAFITYGTSEENAGTVKVNGITAPAVSHQYNIGDSVSVSYKVADGYSFKGWECSDEGAILKIKPEGELYDENGYNEITSTATIILKIINETKNAVFKALVEKIPTVNLQFNTSTENSGTIRLNGVIYGGEKKEYRQGEEVTISFKKNDEYLFQGINANNDIYKVEYASHDSDSFGYDAETKTATIILTIVTEKSIAEVQTVTLETPEIPWAEINVSSPYGRFSTDASRIYREGEKQAIGFTSDPDYQFIRWQVVDLNNGGQEIPGWEEFVDFSDEKNPNMTYKLKKAPENTVKLGIIPLCAKRPKIVSYSPQYSTAGDWRDRTLVIMFNTKMHESSIYYSGDELVELGVVNKNGNNYEPKAAYTLLGNLADGDCYGYYKNADPENSIVFKNIRICKLNNQSVNLLKYYEKPVFDKGNTGTLRIPTKVTDENRDEAPPKYSEILVTIENGINTLVGDEKIKLSEEFAWAYYTNTMTDSAPPEFSNESIDIRVSSEMAREYSDVAGNTALTGFTAGLLTADTDNIKIYNAKNDHIWVKMAVDDTGSGVNAVYGTLTKVHTEYYPNESGQNELLDAKIHFELGGSAQNARIDENINLKEYGLSEGLYSISFEATDKNEHKIYSEHSYQFVYDNIAPEKISAITEVRPAADKTKLKWKNPSEKDFAKIKVVTHNEDDPLEADIETEYELNSLTYKLDTVYDNVVGGLTNQKHYSHKVYAVDYAGNESEITEVAKDTEAPLGLEDFEETRTVSGKATVRWKKPAEPDFERIEIVRKNVTADTAGVKDDISYTAVSSTTYDVEDFNRYEYTAKVYDFSGNVSDEVIFTNTTAPGKISNLKETRTSGTDAKVSWTAPAEVGKVLIKRYNSNNVFEDEFEVLAGENYQNYTTLVKGTRYIYKVTTIDYSGNENTETEDYTDTTPPAKATGIGNLRTSADKETINWTKPADVDFDYIKIVQYDTASNNAKKGEKTADKSVTQIQFTDLTNQHKYAYKISAVDYSGNEGEITEYQDDVGPTSLVSLSNISNSRTSAANESVRWSANPAGSDVDHIIIKQYDGTILNNTFTQSATSTKTASFAGLINQHKYKYRFYSVDYSGNISTNYTEYQDNTPPAYITIRYSEGRNGRVNVFFTTPNDEDYCKTTVSFGTADATQYDISSASGRNNSSYITFNDGKNWTLYNYYFRTYDYSGNCRGYWWHEEMAGAMPGMICYAPGNSSGNIFCSINYYEGMNPIGVVCDGSNQSKVNILALDESSSYVYGENNGAFCEDNVWSDNRGNLWTSDGNKYFNNTDGLVWYQTVQQDKYKDSMNGANGYNSIWYYLKNVKNKNSPVTWWIPARHEWANVGWNNVAVNTTLKLLKTKMSGVYEFSGIYYVSTPHYNNWRVNVISTTGNKDDHINIVLVKNGNFEMRTTAYEGATFDREKRYGFYTRAMAFVDMR